MGAHGHSHGGDTPDVDLRSVTASRVVVGLVAVCVAATVIGLFVIWPSGTDDLVTAPALDVELVDATVTGAETAPCVGAEDLQPSGCIDVDIDVTSGPTKGEEATFQFAQGPNTVDLSPGDRIVVSYNAEAPAGSQYLFADFDRGRSLTALVLLFVASVLALGAFRGLRALIGAVVSLVVLVAVILPALLEGTPPMAVALVGASAIALLALFLTHGLNHRTAVAYVGTTAALALTAVLAQVFASSARLTGLADEEALFLQVSADQVDLSGLLLAGIVIGALGVLDDVTVTQVSAVWELAADGSRTTRELYSSALSIGRDHIASTVNTLVLAYAGAALPLMLLFTQSTQSFSEIVNGEVVAAEIVRALVGSIGLVASVPITTGLAVAVVGTAAAATRSGDEQTAGSEGEPIDESGDGGRPDPGPAESDPVVEPGPEPATPPDWSDFAPDEESF